MLQTHDHKSNHAIYLHARQYHAHLGSARRVVKLPAHQGINLQRRQALSFTEEELGKILSMN